MAGLHVQRSRRGRMLRPKHRDTGDLQPACHSGERELRAAPLRAAHAQLPGLQVCARHIQLHRLAVLPAPGARPQPRLRGAGAPRLGPRPRPSPDALCGPPPKKGGGVRADVGVQSRTRRLLPVTDRQGMHEYIFFTSVVIVKLVKLRGY